MLPSRGAAFSDERLLITVGDRPAGASELWSWNGAAWSVVPGGRFDSDSPLLLAGTGVDGEALAFDEGAAETWRWDGATWMRLASPSPPARFVACMARDTARGEVVLFGGLVPGAAPGTYRGDTWVWNGTVWSERR
jgi:hypothetical protein